MDKKIYSLLCALAFLAGSAFSATTNIECVAYIESSGSQWIDTGVCGKSSVNIVADVMVLESKGSSCLIGERQSSGNNDKLAIWINNSYRTALNCGKLDSGWQGNSILNTRCVISNMNAKLFVDGVCRYNGADQSFASSLTMTLFFLRKSATTLDKDINRPLRARIYGLKIYDEGVLVRDFRPCTATITDEAGEVTVKNGLWDEVGQLFYGDRSGGAVDFIAVAEEKEFPIMPTYTVSQRKVTAAFKVEKLPQDGDVRVTLEGGISENEEAFTDGDTVTLTEPTASTLTWTAPDGHYAACYLRLKFEVVDSEGGVLRTSYSETGEATTIDDATYIWQAVDGVWDGDFTDPAHWTCDAGEDRSDYPLHATTKIEIPAGVTATITGSVDVSCAKLTIRSGSSVTLVPAECSSDMPSFTVKQLGIESAVGFFLDGISLAVDYNTPLGMPGGTRIALRNGAYFGCGQFRMYSKAAPSRFEVSGGAEFNVGYFYLGGGNEVVIDDALFKCRASLCNGDSTEDKDGGGSILFKGANPRLQFTANNSRIGGNCRNENSVLELDFMIPEGGFVSTPITAQSNMQSSFATPTSTAGMGKVRVNILDGSPAVQIPKTIDQNLIEWQMVDDVNGFNMDYLLEGNLPKKASEKAFDIGLTDAGLLSVTFKGGSGGLRIFVR